MSAVFVLLFLASLGLLTWGLIAPRSLAKHASKATKKELTRKHFAIFFGLACFISLMLVGATSPSNAQQGALQPKAQTKAVVAPSPKIEKKTASETKPVAFSSSSVNDPAMSKGSTKVTTTGVDGVETLTYTVTYTDGKQTAKDLVSDTVTTQPVAQVTSVGTYVAPAPVATPTQTYTTPSSGVRTGATCNDGSHSNATGSGACSHHGGVAYWLYN